MSIGFAISLLRGGVFQTLTLAAPVLLIAMTIGLIISIFQATTSIQDQTLTFVPKILGILVTIGFFGGWMISRLGTFTIPLLQLIPEMRG